MGVQCSIGTLRENTDYLNIYLYFVRVRVCSVSAGGIGEYSETCFVNTDPVVPGPPSPPQLVEKPKVGFPDFMVTIYS